MASSPSIPNAAFRQLRGGLSPGEFAAAVRRAAREIGEQVSCDARYIGRVESGEIRCPNYAYERVFRHMFPGYSLGDLGFEPREAVRGRRGTSSAPLTYQTDDTTDDTTDEESDVLRRAFMTGGPAAAVATTLALGAPTLAQAAPAHRVGRTEVRAVEEAVRTIRLHDDRHGADGLYQQAGQSLRTAYRLLDEGSYSQSVADGLQAGAGELAISVGWLAHDSGRFADARSYYAEALATARMAGDPALEAHAFCNAAFLARDAGRPREAVRAAQAAQQAARRLGSPRLLSLLALREAGGRAGLGDRTGCERALVRAQSLFGRGTGDADPEWMSFFGEAELAGLEAQSWAALGDHRRAAEQARRAVGLQDPHFARNTALYGAELAGDLAAAGRPDEAAAAGSRVLDLLGSRVHSTRIRSMLDGAARVMRPYRREAGVADFLHRGRW
ncbi:tetratricopeptide repeat protein [Streptomyces sp. NPDC059373]